MDNCKQPFYKSTFSNETKCNNDVAAKLRKLKIEENFLLQSLKKLDQKRDYEIYDSDNISDVDCENMIKTLKESYMKIKNLFDDIKTVTSSKELLAELDIEEIKQNVLELETKIKSFKFDLTTELNSLKMTEQGLINQLEDLHLEEAINKKQAKISSSKFKQAVPSPVKLMMTSSLKCSDVQQFQDFMKNSPNRYGGWNEYHHNIFVKLWQKHFGNSTDTLDIDPLAENSFMEEASLKLQGINKTSLASHMQWYKKYLLLKSKQQAAIDKWKCSRSSIREVSGDKQVLYDLENMAGNSQQRYVKEKKIFEMPKRIPKIISKEDIQKAMAPTKQWLSRCRDETKCEQIHCVENLEKLRIPNWRKHISS